MTAPFVVRPASKLDEDFLVSSWLYSYARSAYGLARGAHVTQAAEPQSRRPAPDAWARFWAEERPVVVDLLSTADVAVACDPAAPEVVWGWSCVSGSTIHHVLVKRSVHRASAQLEGGTWMVTTGLSGEIYRALLGSRLSQSCGYTHELVDMRRRELQAQGVTIPRSWYCDPTWFARREAA